MSSLSKSAGLLLLGCGAVLVVVALNFSNSLFRELSILFQEGFTRETLTLMGGVTCLSLGVFLALDSKRRG